MTCLCIKKINIIFIKFPVYDEEDKVELPNPNLLLNESLFYLISPIFINSLTSKPNYCKVPKGRTFPFDTNHNIRI